MNPNLTSNINVNVPYGIEPQIQTQPQVVRRESIRRGSINPKAIIRTEIGFQFDFHCVGKYTSQVLPNLFDASAVRSSVIPFSMNPEANMCKVHHEMKEYILLEPVENYKKHDTICKNCLSLLNYKRGSDYKARLFDAVIMDNKEKIKQIRNDKVKLESGSNEECIEACKQTIIPCIDEFIFLSDTFEKEVLSKIEGGNAKSDEVRELKGFVASMELTPEGDPNVFGIGRNEELKNKYIKLALFLIKYSRASDEKISVTGITQYLKNHILQMIALRKVMVTRITDWLKYLIGGFYEEIYAIENIPLDENWRKNLQIDYVSEEELIKMRTFFENELRKRDDHIKFLEDENAKLRQQISELQNNLCVMSENESQLTILQGKFKELEGEWLKQKDIIAGLQNEINKLKNMNNEYLSQIDGLRNELINSKKEYERKIQLSLDQIRNEYERKISDLTNTLNNLQNKYNELEKKYNMDIRQMQIDKENLNNQLISYKKMYENDVNKLNNDIENLTKEIISLKNTLNSKITEINQLINERDRLRGSENDLRNQINQMEMNIKNLMNQISKLTQERDDFKNQLIIMTQERDSLRNQIENLKSQINGMEQTIKNYSLNISNLTDERDNLKQQILQLTNERDNLRSNIEALKNQINQMENQINNLMQTLNNITRERDEARNINIDLKSQIEQMKNDINNLTNIKANLENRLNDLQNRYEDLTKNYNKLQNEFNIKVTIITNLEGKINELNQNIQNLQEKINMYLSNIKKMENEISDLRNTNEEQRIKLLIIPEKEQEITKLKNAISTCREEWNKLSESYEVLLQDIKNQISNNEQLRSIIIDLQGKIETHNQTIGGYDNAVRQQIEILTRQTLAKKNIEYNQNTNDNMVKKTTNEMDTLKMKVGRMESQKLNKSAIFSGVGFQIDETKSTANIAIKRPSITKPLEGSTVYNVKQVVMHEIPNQSYYQQTTNINNGTALGINNNPSIYKSAYLNNDNNLGNNLNANASSYNYNNYNNNVSTFSNNYNVQQNYGSNSNLNSRPYDKNAGQNVFNNYSNFGNLGAAGSVYNPSVITNKTDYINVNVTSEENDK